MLFNSIDFAIFLPLVFLFYWTIPAKKNLRNILILTSSYVFYGWWDWRFLSLVILSSFLDYFIGLKLASTHKQQQKKLFLLTSIIINIGFLAFFKYFNFFTQSFSDAFSLFGIKVSPASLNIVLPIGISFYTFQTLSYSIDIYRNKILPTRDILAFFSYVSFFPQLVAGPIERAKDLLPQFNMAREFNYNKAVDGMRQILWGLFKKVVIADNCAFYVNKIFKNYGDYSGSTLLLGAILFAFQIYGDFSGYSDIAIGTARLFGFHLSRNFAFPYFSRDIAEFWRRWHISLFSWFKDYIYIPLGGNHINRWKTVRNVFIIFLVSSFWHGAKWTFLLWGFINALFFLPLILTKKNREHLDNIKSRKITFKTTLRIIITFLLTSTLWIFFRSQSIQKAFDYLANIFTLSFFSKPAFLPLSPLLFISVLLISEWLQRHKEHALEFSKTSLPKLARWGIYYTILWFILFFGKVNRDFIYFQF